MLRTLAQVVMHTPEDMPLMMSQVTFLLKSTASKLLLLGLLSSLIFFHKIFFALNFFQWEIWSVGFFLYLCDVYAYRARKIFSVPFAEFSRVPFCWAHFLSSWSQSCAKTRKFRRKKRKRSYLWGHLLHTSGHEHHQWNDCKFLFFGNENRWKAKKKKKEKKKEKKERKKEKKKKLPERTKFSSLSAPTKIEELTAESDEKQVTITGKKLGPLHSHETLRGRGKSYSYPFPYKTRGGPGELPWENFSFLSGRNPNFLKFGTKVLHKVTVKSFQLASQDAKNLR